MSRIMLGAVCGVVIGLLDVALMIPGTYPDKKAAMTGAFLNRFAIGFVLGIIRLPWPGWAAGLLLGVLLSLPDAIITKAFAPILGTGAVFGTAVGVVIEKFCR